MIDVSRRQLLLGAAAAPAASLLAAQTEVAPPRRGLLSGSQSAETLLKTLVPQREWKPFPVASDRAEWEALPPDVSDAVLQAGSRHLGQPYAPLPATLFLEFARNGNRSNYQDVRFGRRTQLREMVLAECIDGQGRFLDDIGNGIWTICEETFWGVPAHMGLQRRGHGLPDVTEPVIDLFAAETAALLAWTRYLLGPELDKVHPLIRERIDLEVERRILAVYRDRSDFWWMGWSDRTVNNWNPWINSNCLACTLLMDSDATRRAQMVYKILTSLDRFLDGYHDDGGCAEGPGYWRRAGACLFDSLELLDSASDGAIDHYSEPLVGEIGRYIYRAHIHDDWFANFADAAARLQPDGDLIYRYGAAIGDPELEAFGAFFAQRGSLNTGSLGRALPALFNSAHVRSAEARQPLVRDVWLPGVQAAASRREQGSPEGFYFAAQGGHNAEPHNHNDVGNFIVFLNGQPVLIDVGVEVYTARTFGSERYEIWTMQSAYHNLPTINGVTQSYGREFAARDVSFRADDEEATFALDIAGAYPEEANVTRWLRSIRLDRVSNTLSVTDRFDLSRNSEEVVMNLMTPCQASQTSVREMTLSGGFLQGGAVQVIFEGPEPDRFETEECSTADARLRPVWGDRVFRVQTVWSTLPQSGELRFVLSQT